ncbi:MAG: hypothetical protein U0526_03375 [Candidatus Saccharibacteria bacterium]|jgi:hypothetical protein
MGEKDAPKPDDELTVPEKIARQAELNRLAREARGDYDEPRRSAAYDDLGGMGTHPFDVEPQPDPLEVDGTPTLPNPNPDKPYTPPALPTAEARSAARRGISAARQALKGGTDDSRQAPEEPDPRDNPESPHNKTAQ